MSSRVADLMAARAAEAVTLTDTSFMETLDYSEASIAAIEKAVDDIKYSMPGGKSAANVDRLCELWGAYIGEVFRRQAGGEWVVHEDQYGKVLAIKLPGGTVFPEDKVRKRITQGAEHNLKEYYDTFRELYALGG